MLLYYCAMHLWNRTHILLHHTKYIQRIFVVVYFVYYEKFTYSLKVCCVLLYKRLNTLACSSVPRLILYALNPFSRGRECQQFVPYILDIYLYTWTAHNSWEEYIRAEVSPPGN